MFPAPALGSRLTPAAYDLLLYVVGSTPDDAYRLAREYPGVLWLNDLVLADRTLVAPARGVIIDSRRARDLLDEELGPVPDDTPMWIVPPAVSDASGGVRRGGGGDGPSSFDEVARRILDIARLDLEPARPEQAPPTVSAPAPAPAA